MGPVLAIGVLTLLIVAGHYFLPGRAERVRRALAAQPRALVEEAQGTVRVTGRVRRIGELLRAPLSGRPCVAYEMLVNEAGNGMGSLPYCLVESQQACPFVVADESGEARVDPSGPLRIAVVHDRTGTTSWLGEYPGKHREFARFLHAAGFPATGWLGRWKVFYYAEGVIEEGQVVTVGGSSAHELDPAVRSDPRSVPERLVLRGYVDNPLLISGTRIGS